MDPLQTFIAQQYLNLETFRKNGLGVKTPVWFVQEGEVLYVRTVANSGKVKRIRACAQVNIAPCKANGALIADWVPATAREVTDPQTAQQVKRLLAKKYGLQQKIADLAAIFQKRDYTILEVKPASTG